MTKILRLDGNGNQKEQQMMEASYRHPELSVISLARPVEAGEGLVLPSGSCGTVVHVFAEEKARYYVSTATTAKINGLLP